MNTVAAGRTTTNIPQRMDRLPWSRWHRLVIIALGVTWILDGLEVTIVGALGAVLTHSTTLNFTPSEVGLTASAYLAGSVLGALVFSYLTDRQGRKKWFLITLFLYLSATVLTAFAWDLWSFIAFRFLAGAGIGGEYAAINSAVDELIPARVRGHTDLVINGSWWLGAVAGALLTIPLLNPLIVPEHLGWRLCFGLGAVLGLAIILIRRLLPESPRWLVTQGRVEEAEAIVVDIEDMVMRSEGLDALPEPEGSLTLAPRGKSGFATVARELLRTYPKRTVLGLSLMVSQSFLYNAIFFTFAIVLERFYGVPAGRVGLYIIPFAVVNFLGPLLLGRFFDTVGRKPMITFTYGTSGILLAATGVLFSQGHLTAVTQTLAWSAVFFFASAGASSAYLTVSEIFPMEIRAMAIALFFVVAQGAATVAPWLFGALIEASPMGVLYSNLIGAGLMMAGAVAALLFGVKAERRALEHIASPLAARFDEVE
jgi:MFS family permease